MSVLVNSDGQVLVTADHKALKVMREEELVEPVMMTRKENTYAPTAAEFEKFKD